MTSDLSSSPSLVRGVRLGSQPAIPFASIITGVQSWVCMIRTNLRRALGHVDFHVPCGASTWQRKITSYVISPTLPHPRTVPPPRAKSIAYSGKLAC
jgi:hypothetical protein